jgi:DNA repair photolyase
VQIPLLRHADEKEVGVISSYEDWCRPKIVENALELLERELLKYNGKIKSVHLCFTTDPFMYGYDEVGQLSLKLIRRINQEGILCTVLTKGMYPREIAQAKEMSINEFGITLVSLDEGFRKNFEPNTAGFEKRIKSLKYLSERGFKTWASIEPYPTPNIIRQDLTKILEAVSFVNRIIFGRLNYSPAVRAFPHIKDYYNSLAKTVIAFCKKNNISCHIKEGTLNTHPLIPSA